MTLKVIGAGFGRTGTVSLKVALEQLGFGPCYHMSEVFANAPHLQQWIDAADGKPDWDTLLASVRMLAERLPPETVVHPGHGPETTLGVELARTPFLAELRAQA